MDGKNLILALLCINLVLYFSGFALTDDLLTRFVSKDNIDGGNIGLKSNITELIPEDPSGGSIISGSSLGFLDVILILWEFVLLLFNIVTAPVALFTIGLHPTISVLIGVPYVVMLLLAIVQFTRGAQL